MYIPLRVKSDYSLHKSLIKIDNLIKYCKLNNISSCGLCDDNLFSAIEFYHKCKLNNIKPIIGLCLKIEDHLIYLYAQNYQGYLNLIQINTLIQKTTLNIENLKSNSQNIICVIDYNDNQIYNELTTIYKDVYLSYSSEYEKNNALIITANILYAPLILAFKESDTIYLNYLNMIKEATTINKSQIKKYKNNYFLEDYTKEDVQTTIDFASNINFNIPTSKKYIPKYNSDIDSYTYLNALTKKGLLKRLNNKMIKKYFDRLEYELSVIKQMGFVDYFLIVYDYILFAKKNDILVGPGRGSAAGSIVAYSLGITDIDPLKYDLLFERFLNKDRVTMPDIDVDFEDTKRNLVIDYLKRRYNQDNVANIMTYSTLQAKQVLRDVSKVLEFSEDKINSLLKLIDPKKKLEDNLKSSNELQTLIKKDLDLNKLYKIALKLEGLKRQISTHAAGVIICSQRLDSLIPVVILNDGILTGTTMEYLEELGLLKVDILAIKNLRVIKDVLNLIKKLYGKDIKLSDIPLDDQKTLEMFKKGNTVGIFQFESEGMKSFLKKLKPSSFDDLISAIALYRPGPMENIDEFIRRKEKKTAIVYPHPNLESILKNTYGIIVYQEQIMQILVLMGGYSYSEADNIRRAMSKKKKDVIDKEKLVFINRAIKLGYKKDIANEVYDLISKFANYGFNKSHSVAYALVGYQMAYLKAHFESIFYTNLLNMSISSEVKTQEYLQVVKQANIKIYHPSINKSTNKYIITKDNLLLPLGIIKNVGSACVEEILQVRQGGLFSDFYDFVKRTYGKSITKKVIESLIYAGAFLEFKVNKKTLINAIDDAIVYAELTKDIASPLILKPTLEYKEEFSSSELIRLEKETLGFYVTNHPASKYKDNITKLENVKNYFDKYVKCVILVNRINNIVTKNNQKMSFITGEDETGILDFVIFPNKISLLSLFKQDDLLLVTGKVEKRIDKYQIVVSNLEKIK